MYGSYDIAEIVNIQNRAIQKLALQTIGFYIELNQTRYFTSQSLEATPLRQVGSSGSENIASMESITDRFSWNGSTIYLYC